MYLHVWMRLSKILLVGFTFTYLHEQRLLHLKARDGGLDQITSEIISNTHGVLRRDRGTLVPTPFMKSGDQGPEGL